jgi:hypothetical protein
MEMWTSLQNAQLDHITTPPTHTYPQECAYGLTRFACLMPFFYCYIKPQRLDAFSLITKPSKKLRGHSDQMQSVV